MPAPIDTAARFGRAALVIAHPAHELRLLAWMGRVRPTLFALTDGGGRSGTPRAARTADVVRGCGGRIGALFGELPDRVVYQSLLEHDYDSLLRVADRLTDAFVRGRFETVVVDAHEDAFLSHDVLNALTRAAVLAASERLGRPIACYDFALEAAPSACPPERRANAVWLRLSLDELRRKLEVARSYREVRTEVDDAFARFGERAFAVECLRPVRDLGAIRTPLGQPEYERHGERLVARGAYRRVVRFEEHVLPLVERLADTAPVAVGAA